MTGAVATFPYPLLHLAGDPETMGFEHGRRAETLIRGFLNVGLARLNRYRQYSREQALARAEEFIPYMEAFAPHLLTELKALASGAHMTLQEVAFLQVRTELSYEGLCSAVVVRPPATAPGTVLMGQNMDLDPAFRTFGLLIHRRPSDAPAMLGFSWPGLVGYMGLNSAGLGVCVTQLVSSGWRPGVPAYFVSRRLLEQNSTQACRAVMAAAQRASSPNWLVADSRGDVIDFETTAGKHVELKPEGPVFAHTNHYLHPPFSVEDLLIDELPDSPARQRRLTELLETGANASELGVVSIQRYLRDHEGHPVSVCRHAAGKPGAIETMVSAVFDLGRRELHLAAGPPCQTDFTTISVDE